MLLRGTHYQEHILGRADSQQRLAMCTDVNSATVVQAKLLMADYLWIDIISQRLLHIAVERKAIGDLITASWDFHFPSFQLPYIPEVVVELDLSSFSSIP